jgi:hypothetical protein
MIIGKPAKFQNITYNSLGFTTIKSMFKFERLGESEEI